jgi:hypothetical protein
VITVDIRCDLNDEDETGLPFAFVDEAADPSLIIAGAIVVAGDEDDPAVAEVVDVVDKPSGKVAHLNLLPGTVGDYERLVKRVVTSA